MGPTLPLRTGARALPSHLHSGGNMPSMSLRQCQGADVGSGQAHPCPIRASILIVNLRSR